MECMHCLVEFHAKQQVTYVGQDVDGMWVILRYDCPACERMNLFLLNVEYYQTNRFEGEISRVAIRPKGASRPPCPFEVPAAIAEDYTEACLVLPDSAKASAALSRRCLQSLLREAAGVKPGSLAGEIQQVVDSGALPSYLVDVVDAVRNIGNFAAHPIKGQRTGEVLPVEPGEAEWNLDVLEGLFDFYYVQPARVAAKRAALDAKLEDAGKKPVK